MRRSLRKSHVSPLKVSRLTLLAMSAFATDADLLRGLRTRDNTAYAQLYAGHYPAIEWHVRQRGGSAAAAQDVFQETLLVLLARLDQPDFALTAALKTYVFAIAANLWLKHLRRDRRYEPLDDTPDDRLAAATLPDAAVADEEDSAVQARHWLARLTARCQQLLAAGGVFRGSGHSTAHRSARLRFGAYRSKPEI